jgi:hypothetical protein
MIPCPYCGGEVHARPNPVELIGAIRLGYMGRAIALFLATKRFNKWTFSKDIAQVVYAADKDGGPLHANTSIRAIIATMKPRLAHMGLVLESKPNCGYRLRWKDAA